MLREELSQKRLEMLGELNEEINQAAHTVTAVVRQYALDVLQGAECFPLLEELRFNVAISSYGISIFGIASYAAKNIFISFSESLGKRLEYYANANNTKLLEKIESCLNEIFLANGIEKNSEWEPVSQGMNTSWRCEFRIVL